MCATPLHNTTNSNIRFYDPEKQQVSDSIQTLLACPAGTVILLFLIRISLVVVNTVHLGL